MASIHEDVMVAGPISFPKGYSSVIHKQTLSFLYKESELVRSADVLSCSDKIIAYRFVLGFHVSQHPKSVGY